MKLLHSTYCFILGLLIAFCSISKSLAQNHSIDSSGFRSANALILARLIKEYAYFHGGTGVFRYDAHVNTTAGLKLYISQEVSVLGGPSNIEWYYIDFEEAIKANELKVVQGKNGNFIIDASKRITKKVKYRMRKGHLQERERNARLVIFFLTNKKKRKVDFEQLQNQFTNLISQLIYD